VTRVLLSNFRHLPRMGHERLSVFASKRGSRPLCLDLPDEFDRSTTAYAIESKPRPILRTYTGGAKAVYGSGSTLSALIATLTAATPPFSRAACHQPTGGGTAS